MAITALPTPPSRSAPSTFSTLADAFLGALPVFATEANATAAAMNLNDTTATSVTSLLIEVASKSLTVDVSKSYQPGMSVKIARTSSPSNWMHGDVTTYNAGTGALVVNVTSILGNGTFTDWTITFSAPSMPTVYSSSAEILAGTEAAKAIAPDQLLAANIRLPMGHISGLVLSHDTDTEHDINVTAGKARDATDVADMVLASEITKQVDAAWAVGNDAGGMDTGAVPASATVHVWLIKRSDTGVVDALFSISATAPTIPANYDYKRLIGSYRTDASNNILNGDWWGTGTNRTFMYDTPILDVSTANSGTSAVTAALSTPGGIAVRAHVNIADAAGTPYASALNNADMVPSITLAPLATEGSNTHQAGTLATVITNTSSQIRYRCLADVAIYIATLGWEQTL